MPIVDVELVCSAAESTNLPTAGSLASALGQTFGTPPGRTWIRVRTDDGRSTEESIPAGEVREFVSNRPFVVTVGNAAGVSLELNGRLLPPLGARGAVIPRLVLPPETR